MEPDEVKMDVLSNLRFNAYRDCDRHWYNLRKVIYEVYDDADCFGLIYRVRYFTAFFPLVKRRAAIRRVIRLLKMEGKL